MSDVKILGRAVALESGSAPPATSNERAHDKAQITLSEAAAVSGVRVHQLKAAIYDGALHALRRGRVEVKRADLDKWVRENWQLREP